MKVRGRHRPRRPRITVYDANWRPVWPQPLHIEIVAWTDPNLMGGVDGHLRIGRKVQFTSGEQAHLITDIGTPATERTRP